MDQGSARDVSTVVIKEHKSYTYLADIYLDVYRGPVYNKEPMEFFDIEKSFIHITPALTQNRQSEARSTEESDV